MASSTLTHQTVLVTGASRGIGAATAQAFHAAGARVALVARDVHRLERVAADLGDRAVVVPGDTSDPAECRRIATAAAERLGAPVDILVANAGVLRRDWVEDISVEDFEASYRTNVGGGLWLAQALLPGMRERGHGAIVLVSSELGLIGAPTYGSYCMSKFALIGLAETLSHELAGSGVHACAVCPGNVATDQMTEEIAWGPAAGASLEKALTAEQVAQTILRAACGNATVVLADKPALKAGFDAMFAMPRRLRLLIIRDAYKALLKERRQSLRSGSGA
ncbi:MAG TPA: SDR family NAD(P)-dependent oxidoreductase [Solirubrobacteraceae bacterium]|nr:SDR family NAD(P)-dependent oxidoreductase [Solirubrobacteraceae bacterium]